MVNLTAVVARARKGVIGLNNRMPWHLPEDLAHFRRLTTGHPVIMGRRTLESIGKALPERKMIVLTHKASTLPEYAHAASSLDAAIAMCAGSEEAFVIGGAQVYRQALPLCKRLVMTEIDIDAPGDAWFADPEPEQWIRLDRQEFISKSGLPYSINVYRQREAHEVSAQA